MGFRIVRFFERHLHDTYFVALVLMIRLPVIAGISTQMQCGIYSFFLTAEALTMEETSLDLPKNPVKQPESWDAGTSMLPPGYAHEGGRHKHKPF